jgi:hypothetical protein
MRIDCANAAAPYFAPRLAAALVKHTRDNPFEDWSARAIQEAITQVKAAVKLAKSQQGEDRLATSCTPRRIHTMLPSHGRAAPLADVCG